MEKTAGVSIIEPVPLLADEVFVRNPPVSETGGGDISVLSVSPFPDDPDAVERILHPPQWNVHKARTLKSAMAVFKRNRPPLIVCECNLGQETWRELLAEITLTPEPPLLIVASRLADDYLWAEALNLGAYDVLAKPFDQGGTHANPHIRLVALARPARRRQTVGIIVGGQRLAGRCSVERKWKMASYAKMVVPDVTTSPDAQPAVAEIDETRIAALAYQLWQERGCPIGSDQDDWFRAETMLRSQSEDPAKVLVAAT